MKILSAIFYFSFLLLPGCESQSFDRDKRQIIAKDEIRRRLPYAGSFDITGFREDTLSSWPDTNIKHPIRYMLNMLCADSTGILKNKTGIVVFTPDGRSVISSQIVDNTQ